MASITTTVRAVTVPPKATDVDPTAISSDPNSILSFVTGTEQFHTDLADQVVADINAVGTEMNAVKDEVNTSRDTAVTSASTASASANNHGAWSALTGAFPIGEAVNHNSGTWISNIEIADVTLSEPTDINTDWTKVALNVNTSTNLVNTGSITEETAVATDVLEPDNGTIQYRTLVADTTFTDGLAEGQTLTLYLTNGGFVPTYPTITWDGDAEPTLGTTDRLYFEKVNGTLYGFHTATFV